MIVSFISAVVFLALLLTFDFQLKWFWSQKSIENNEHDTVSLTDMQPILEIARDNGLVGTLPFRHERRKWHWVHDWPNTHFHPKTYASHISIPWTFLSCWFCEIRCGPVEIAEPCAIQYGVIWIWFNKFQWSHMH